MDFFEFILLLGCLYSSLSSNLGIFHHYFFKYSLCPFLSPPSRDSLNAYVGLLDGIPSSPLGSLFAFLQSFSLSQSRKFLLSCLQVLLIVLLPAQVLPLNLSGDFFISFIVLFRSRITFWCFF